MDPFAVVPRSPELQAALSTLYALAANDLKAFVGPEATELADYLLRSQRQEDVGARWGDVERLSNMLWQRAEARTFGDSFFPDRRQTAAYLMEVADLLTFQPTTRSLSDGNEPATR